MYFEVYNNVSGQSLGLYKGIDSQDAIGEFEAQGGVTADEMTTDVQAREVWAFQGFPASVLRDLREAIGNESTHAQAKDLYDLGTEDRSYDPPLWWIADINDAIEKVIALKGGN